MSHLDDAIRHADAAIQRSDLAEQWLSVKEFAASRGVHVQTVYSAIRRGLFKHEVDRSTPRTIRIKISRAA